MPAKKEEKVLKGKMPLSVDTKKRREKGGNVPDDKALSCGPGRKDGAFVTEEGKGREGDPSPRTHLLMVSAEERRNEGAVLIFAGGGGKKREGGEGVLKARGETIISRVEDQSQGLSVLRDEKRGKGKKKKKKSAVTFFSPLFHLTEKKVGGRRRAGRKGRRRRERKLAAVPSFPTPPPKPTERGDA